MALTWIIVARRSGAALYAHAARGALARVRDIPHPEGRLKDREIVSDRPGRAHESGTVRRCAVGTDRAPSRALAEGFARSLADALGRALDERAYDRLVLVAEPRFLGMLRGALNAQTAAAVVGSVAKELPLASAAAVRESLRPILDV